jgi:TldD protein
LIKCKEAGLLELPPHDDILDTLRFAVTRGAGFAELYFEASCTHAILCESRNIERISSGSDTGFGLRLVSNGRTAYGYSSILGRGELLRVAEGLLKELEDAPGSFSGPEALIECGGSTNENHPSAAGIDDKIALVLAADRMARDAGDEISQVRVMYADSLKRICVFNSEGIASCDTRPQIVFNIRAVASGAEGLQTALRSIGGGKGFGLPQQALVEKTASEAGRRAIEILHAPSAPAGRMEVVLASEAGGTMIHEAIGHGLEGDSAQKGLSIYSGKMGEPVASEAITVIDDATLAGKRGSYECDDEGTPSQRTVAVEKGVLKNYLLDKVTASKMGLQSTGNGRRESFRFRPIVRMSNTMIAPGDHEPAEIIDGVLKGLFVVRMGGGQVDTTSGDFVFKINEAYLIEKGKVTSPVRGATLIGNGPDVLERIDMVGNDLGFDIGTCGKDGQHVPVSDAQPTIRIPDITVGGEV